MDNFKDFLKRLFTFGACSLEKICSILFITGSILWLMKAFNIGRMVYLTNTYTKMLKNGVFYTGIEVNNLPLALLVGLISFVIGALFWRLICEIIYIVLRYFKNNTNLPSKEEIIEETINTEDTNDEI